MVTGTKTTTATTPFRTTGQAARELGIEPWQLLRLLSLKRVPEPDRCGSLRAWTDGDIRNAREALAMGKGRGE